MAVYVTIHIAIQQSGASRNQGQKRKTKMNHPNRSAKTQCKMCGSKFTGELCPKCNPACNICGALQSINEVEGGYCLHCDNGHQKNG